MKATLPYFLDTFTHFCIQQCCYFSVLLVGQGIRPYAGDFRFDDDAAAVVDGSTSGYGGGDVCVSALAHGKIVFVVEIEWALSVPIRFGQIGVVGSDNVGLRHVPTFLLREGETIWNGSGNGAREWGIAMLRKYNLWMERVIVTSRVFVSVFV